MDDKDYLGFSGTIISALRYCIGRKTYMPSLVTDYVSRYLSKLSIPHLEVIKQDIIKHGKYFSKEQSKDVDERGLYPGCYGDRCDYDTWMTFLYRVENELERRSRQNESK